jgi:hypothetical protein
MNTNCGRCPQDARDEDHDCAAPDCARQTVPLAWKVETWEAINAYVRSCGGEPHRATYGNAVRQKAVAAVEAQFEKAFSAQGDSK